MPRARDVKQQAGSGFAKSAKPTPVGPRSRQSVTRRDLEALSERIDRDLALLLADTDRLAAQVLSK